MDNARFAEWKANQLSPGFFEGFPYAQDSVAAVRVRSNGAANLESRIGDPVCNVTWVLGIEAYFSASPSLPRDF